VTSLSEDLQGRENQIVAIQQENTDLKNKVDDLEATIEKIGQEKSQQKNEIETLINKLNDAEETSKTNQQTCLETLDNEKRDLTGKLEALSIAHSTEINQLREILEKFKFLENNVNQKL
jgi:uncharacterized coiled-coil DUF342 family protein